MKTLLLSAALLISSIPMAYSQSNFQELLRCSNTSVNPNLTIIISSVGPDQYHDKKSLLAMLIEGDPKNKADIINSLVYPIKLVKLGSTFVSLDTVGFMDFKMAKANDTGRFVTLTYKNKRGDMVTPGYTTRCDREW